jgi:GntR family transcriptional regulator, rspAB operon transcriptional repressor
VPLSNATPFKKDILSDGVYLELRRQIVDGHLQGGERLDIFSIAEALGVSRTPVKDAFNRLSLEGLITIRPHRGTFVSLITPDTLRELFDVRLMIEMWAIRAVAADRSLLDSARMTAIIERCEAILAAPGDFDWERFVAADRELHDLIVCGPRNALLSRMYESVFPRIQLVRVYWSKTRERACLSHQQHHAFVTALQKGTAEELERALETHILSSRDHVLGMVKAEAGAAP